MPSRDSRRRMQQRVKRLRQPCRWFALGYDLAALRRGCTRPLELVHSATGTLGNAGTLSKKLG